MRSRRPTPSRRSTPRTIEVARLEFALVRSAEEWKESAPPRSIREAQAAIAWAEHLVILFPLWLVEEAELNI